MYAPSSLTETPVLWEAIKTVVDQKGDMFLCVAGDFNSIRNSCERVGRGLTNNTRDIAEFVDFIVQSNLIDLPPCWEVFHMV